MKELSLLKSGMLRKSTAILTEHILVELILSWGDFLMRPARPKVIVQGPSPEELKQREEQFQQEMATLQQQQEAQKTLAQEQIAQQSNIAGVQQSELLRQLVAQGNISATSSYNNMLQLLAQQRNVGASNVTNERVSQANVAQQAKQASNVVAEAGQANTSRQDILSKLNRRRLSYGSTK